MSSHNSFDSEDEDSDDTSEHLDHDYDLSNGGGGKKVVNKGRWTKEEVNKDGSCIFEYFIRRKWYINLKILLKLALFGKKFS